MTIGDSYRVVRPLAAILLLSLSAASSPARAQVKVVGCDVHATEPDAAAPAAIRIVGARNGAFSGKVFVVSTSPIMGLKATAGDLKQGAATIPAAACRTGLAVAWNTSGWGWPSGPDMLYDALPPDANDGPTRVPVWVSIKVPKDAKPGVYTGEVAIEAKGLARTSVPVMLEVHEWTLPDPENYRTWVEVIEEPDTLAAEYNVPLWSSRHWELIARSMKLIADTGSRVIYVPLIAQANYGNSESMVRWIQKGHNQYEYDFSIVDKYLDCVEKNLGRPKLTMVYAWETYLRPPSGKVKEVVIDPKWKENSYEWREAMKAKLALENQNKGPLVTAVRADGKGEPNTMYLPRYEDPACKALWKPVYDGLRERLAKRGWDKTMMLAMFSDYGPSAAETAALKDVSGGLLWAGCAHHINCVRVNQTLGKLEGGAEVGYAAAALDEWYSLNPAKQDFSKQPRCYGWKQSTLYPHYWRFGVFNADLLSVHYQVERLVTGNKRGIAHIGGDFWPALKNNSGRRTGTVTDRYPQSYWHSLNVGGWLLGAGPTGPVTTGRMEIFRQGLQECEARIAIEAALSEPALKAKLGDDLARRAQDHLDERLVGIWKGVGVQDADLDAYPLITAYRDYLGEKGIARRLDAKAGYKWFLASEWQKRTGQLFDLAAEVEKKLGAK